MKTPKKRFSSSSVGNLYSDQIDDHAKDILRKLYSSFGLPFTHGNRESISIFLLFHRILTNKIVISTDDFSFGTPPPSYVQRDPSLHLFKLSRSNLPDFLLDLRNSGAPEKLDRFERIRDTFRSLNAEQIDLLIRPPDNQSKENPRLKPEILIRKMNSSKILPIDSMGAGLGEVLYLLSVTIGLRESVLLLDEPSLNLHPLMMKRLMRKLSEYGNQTAVITHSPELLRFEFFENDGHIVNIRKRDGMSLIFQPHPEDESWLKNQRSKLEYLIDPRIFFSRGVLLCEGETDKSFLTSAAMGYSINLLLKDVAIVPAGSETIIGFYCYLLDLFSIPFVVLVDEYAKEFEKVESKGATREELNQLLSKRAVAYTRKKGEKFGVVFSDRIEYEKNTRIFFLKHDLEDFLNSISTGLGERNSDYIREFVIQNKDRFEKNIKPLLDILIPS